MPKEIPFSSYICDCGHQIDFSENTVGEIKRKSKRKRQWLIETCADRAEEHVIVFDDGISPAQGPRADGISRGNNTPGSAWKLLRGLCCGAWKLKGFPQIFHFRSHRVVPG